MAVRADFVQHCSELLSALGDVSGKRMFGGWGLYVDGVFVAIIAGETLYLKTDETTRPSFAEAGCAPFEYMARGELHSMSYWSVPSQAMDSPALMTPWARLAMEAALRKRGATKATKRRQR